MTWIRRFWCRLTAHRRPFDVEHGRVLAFVVFRCSRCKAQWFVGCED